MISGELTMASHVRRSEVQRVNIRPISRRRRNLFRIVCVCLPLVALGLAEGALRLAGFGGYPDFFRELRLPDGTTLVVTNKAGPSAYFYANPDQPGTNNEFSFVMPKPPNTTRIFLCGASAMKGFPQPVAFSAGSFLQNMLQEFWPDRRIEVINLSTTAVASFPVLDVVTKAVRYAPDLVIVYTGNNEFFGAYGVGAVKHGLASPWWLATQFRLRSLALIQGVQHLLLDTEAMEGRTLMEFMLGDLRVSPDSSLRDGAARLLHHHVSEIVNTCEAQGIPVLVCLPAANNRGLAPLGEVDIDALPEDVRRSVERSMNRARQRLEESPDQARELLVQVIRQAPKHATAHYLLAQCEERLGNTTDALSHYQQAVDLDTMPWRPPSRSVDAILRAASAKGAVVCDVPAAFRQWSADAGIGWELMDDHVHFSLLGQFVLARTLTRAFTEFSPPLHVEPKALEQAANFETVAKRLGHNPYDAYGVAVQMSKIFGIPFMRRSNPDAYRRWSETVTRAEQSMSPALKKIAKKWQDRRTHTGAMRPLSGMVARVLLREGKFAQAAELFKAAQLSVPEYSAWHMEYVYFSLACAQKLNKNGALTATEQAVALEELRRGKVLLSFGKSQSGMAARYMGRLHQLRQEFAEAIGYLESARTRLFGFDRVAADQALIVSYMKTGQPDAARRLAREGIQLSGSYRNLYQTMLDSIPE
jgi:tetratricopeptide (TPR) repeat protein